MQGVMWNLWHGCHKKSEGCLNCYVYRRDAQVDRDADKILKTKKFYIPIAKNRQGGYKYPSGSLFWTCFTSDFLIEEADEWRKEAFDIMRERSDCRFMFITKRIERLREVLPADWGEGWDNVTVCATAENQRRADERLPILTSLPLKHKSIVVEPILGRVDLEKYLDESIEEVIAGGESGYKARVCDFDWIKALREQCLRCGVTFTFKQTGAKFCRDGKLYSVPRKFQHSQAKKAGIDYEGKFTSYLRHPSKVTGKSEQQTFI